MKSRPCNDANDVIIANDNVIHVNMAVMTPTLFITFVINYRLLVVTYNDHGVGGLHGWCPPSPGEGWWGLYTVSPRWRLIRLYVPYNGVVIL